MSRENYDLGFSALLDCYSCTLGGLEDRILYVTFLTIESLGCFSGPVAPIHALGAGGTGLTPGRASSACLGVLERFFPKCFSADLEVSQNNSSRLKRV